MKLTTCGGCCHIFTTYGGCYEYSSFRFCWLFNWI